MEKNHNNKAIDLGHIDLHDYFDIIFKRKKIFLICLILQTARGLMPIIILTQYGFNGN